MFLPYTSCMHTHIYVGSVCVCTCVCVFICTYVPNICVYTYVCTCVCVCIYIYMYPYIYVFDAVDKDFSCSTPKAQATKPSLYECVLVSFQFQFPLSLLLCTNILDFYVLTLYSVVC